MPATVTTPLEHFGLTELIEAAGTPALYLRSASAISQAVAKQVPGVGLNTSGRHGAAAYWLPFESARDLNTGLPSAGGNLVAGPRFGRLLEAARPATILQAAGAQLVQITGGTAGTAGEFVLAAWDQAAGADWCVESAPAPEADLSVKTATASPKLLGARIKISRRMLLQGVAPVEGQMLDELGRAIRVRAEHGFFNGNGSMGQPLGLLNVPGTIAESFVGATPTFSELVGMVEEALKAEADFSRLVFMCNPLMLTALMQTQVTAGNADMVAACVHGIRQLSMAGLPVLASSVIPQKKILLLDPTRLAIARWDAPQVLVDRFSNGKSINGGAEVVLLDSMDLVAGRPEQIVIGTAA